MRLICPNCDAQYEVVDDVIPTEGRDVQCSNCGQTWFQHHRDHKPVTADEIDDPAHVAEPDDAPAEDEVRIATPPRPKRRELDASVADILRQEAELEAKARDGQVLESQPDLGLPDTENDADRRGQQARDRMARLRGETPEPTESEVTEEAATAAALGSRRDLLPDIEEINSTLRSSGDRQSGAAGAGARMMPPPPQKKSGFRSGFLLMIVLAVGLGAIYVFAPQIAQTVPQADPYLSGYVAQIDTVRATLDGQVRSLLAWLDALASSQEN